MASNGASHRIIFSASSRSIAIQHQWIAACKHLQCIGAAPTLDHRQRIAAIGGVCRWARGIHGESVVPLSEEQIHRIKVQVGDAAGI